ncbi:unnamed protein product [Caretta caretta]
MPTGRSVHTSGTFAVEVSALNTHHTVSTGPVQPESTLPACLYSLEQQLAVAPVAFWSWTQKEGNRSLREEPSAELVAAMHSLDMERRKTGPGGDRCHKRLLSPRL